MFISDNTKLHNSNNINMYNSISKNKHKSNNKKQFQKHQHVHGKVLEELLFLRTDSFNQIVSICTINPSIPDKRIIFTPSTSTNCTIKAIWQHNSCCSQDIVGSCSIGAEYSLQHHNLQHTTTQVKHSLNQPDTINTTCQGCLEIA